MRELEIHNIYIFKKTYKNINAAGLEPAPPGSKYML